MMVETIKNIKGEIESPSALSIEAIKLYIYTNKSTRHIYLTYIVASGSISTGVLKSCKSQGALIYPIVPNKRGTIKRIKPVLTIHFLTLSSSFAP